MKAISVLKFVGKMFGWAIIFLLIYYLYLLVPGDWFFWRFSHAFHAFADINAPTMFELFVRKLKLLINHYWEVCSALVFLLSVITCVVIHIMSKRRVRKNKSVKPVWGVYFCTMLFCIVNLRFWGDTTNCNVAKGEWYYIFVAIPSYLQLLLLCFMYYVQFLKQETRTVILKNVYELFQRPIGKAYLFLALVYVVCYIVGSMGKVVFSYTTGMGAYRLHHQTISEMYSCYVDNRTFVAVCILLVVLISVGIYIWLVRKFKVQSLLSVDKGLRFLLNSFLYMIIAASTVKVLSEDYCFATEGIPHYNCYSVYPPLVITCVIFLMTPISYQSSPKRDS